MSSRMNRKVAKELLALANALVAEEESEEMDQKFLDKIKELKQFASKLGPKKAKRLNTFGVGVIKPTATVEELVDALRKVVAA